MSGPDSASPTAASSAQGRLVSLDAFRGLAIAAMVLVNNPGSWDYVYWPLAHAEWHGWTPTDLIFPHFLFIVGASIPYSFARRIGAGASRSTLSIHVLRRAGILILLGLIMRAVPDFDFGEMRLVGVLQRIGLVYLAAAGLYLWSTVRGRMVATTALLLGYWALLMLVPVPGHGAGDLSPDGNLAAYLDRLLMPGRLYEGTWDPEGILSTLPATATCLLGIFAGEWTRSDPVDMPITRRLLVAGSVLCVAGWAWGLVFPLNKNLWTSSYVLFSGGTAFLLLGIFHWTLDEKKRRGRWHVPFVVYGTNAIAVFVASGMLAKAMVRVRVPGGGDVSLYDWTFQHVFQPWAGDYNGSLAFAITYVALWLGAAWLLHERRIYLKI